MKILLCSPYLNEEGIHRGGINIWADNILQYYRALEKNSVEITPVSFDRRHYVSVHTSKLKRIYWGIKELSKSIGKVERELKNHKFDVVHICTSASMSLLKDLMLIRLAKKYAAKSIVHLHFGRTTELIKTNNWEWKLLKKVIVKADSVITMDMLTYNSLRSCNFENVYYCPNPLSKLIIDQVELEKGTVERDLNKLLFVGHVLPSKGVYELVNACKELDGIELHIVGKAEGNIIDDLKRIASENKGGNWLKIRGEMSHDNVLRELMSSGLFVFPSYTEGFPNVILEAMACGCPIASSNVGAIPEMLDIENNPCGVCYDPQCVGVVVDAIRLLMDDANLRQKYVTMAESRVYSEYTIDRVYERLLFIWEGKY